MRLALLISLRLRRLVPIVVVLGLLGLGSGCNDNDTRFIEEQDALDAQDVGDAIDAAVDVTAVDAAEVAAELPPDVADDVAPEIPVDVAADIAPDTVPDVAAEVVPDVAPEATATADAGVDSGPDGFDCTDKAKCDDGNPCTIDNCEPIGGCNHTPNKEVCDDKNACTTADTCTEGVCKGLEPLGCDDDNPCTDDSCAPSTGCAHLPNSASCTDGSACTQADACAKGKCQSGGALNCGDGNVCTDDSCDPAKGCTFAPVTANCGNGNLCTPNDNCQKGACIGGPSLDCEDNNPCTEDGCGATEGCKHIANTAKCDDGSVCTTGDLCKNASCLPGAAKDCDDGNACTDDSCDKTTGCAHLPNTATCTDSSVCTANDSCKGGVCLPGATTNCDDSNPCTDDACDKASGCTNKDNAATCSDGNACTVGDQCAKGKCTPTTFGSYDAAKDFVAQATGTPANPNSVWSYGQKATQTAALTLYGAANGDTWSAGGFPLIMANITSDVTHPFNTATLKPGQLLLHPGAKGEISVVRFTAPAAGNYNLVANFAGASGFNGTQLTTTDVSVTVNGKLLFTGNINVGGKGNTSTFSDGGQLVKGDTIDVAVGFGNADYGFDSTIVDAVILNVDVPDCDDKNVCTTDTCESNFGCVHTATGQQLCTAGKTTNGMCGQGVCNTATCTDAFADGVETDLDCGGNLCGGCGNGKKCLKSTDCASAFCDKGICAKTTCGDGLTQGAEECDDANLVDADVCSNACKLNPVNCSDKIQNGLETDVDCGPGTVQCPACKAGQKCKESSNCATGNCGTNGLCMLPKFEVAGTLYVDLRAYDEVVGTGGWPNHGTLGAYTAVGKPTYANGPETSSNPGVKFNGLDTAYVGPAPPADISGSSDRTVEVWVYNPSVDSAEEAVVAMGRRGAARKELSVNFGSSPNYGAVTHFSDDVAWSKLPEVLVWNHFVYVYDGATGVKVYVNGALNNSKTLGGVLGTTTENMTLAVERHMNDATKLAFKNEGDGSQMAFSGFIGTVRIHGGQLTANQIINNYVAGVGFGCAVNADCATNVCVNNTCTNPNAGCSNPTKLDGAPCTDASLCTGKGLCSGGACVGEKLNCDDNNPCTADACNPTTGCAHTALSGACSISGKVCGGTCTAGACVEILPVPETCNGLDDNCDGAIDNGNLCDDGNSCTADSCQGSCKFTNAANGTTCAGGGQCALGVCVVPSCTDKLKNGTETDVDCGGSCPACKGGQTCAANTDCVSANCTSGKQCGIPLVKVAGSLVVDLRAYDQSVGTSGWPNHGSAGPFLATGSPAFVNDGSSSNKPAVQFNGASTAYIGPAGPSSVTGNAARSIEVWAFNPSIDSDEECMVSLGLRGVKWATLALNYGNPTGGASAVTHWFDDLAWAPAPQANGWHHIVYVYDGSGSVIVYVDGAQKLTKTLGAALITTTATMTIAAPHKQDNPGALTFTHEQFSNVQLGFSGLIHAVRIHAGALKAAEVGTNFSLGMVTNCAADADCATMSCVSGACVNPGNSCSNPTKLDGTSCGSGKTCLAGVCKLNGP